MDAHASSWTGFFERETRIEDAVGAYTTFPEDTYPLDKQRARYKALKTARDRALVFVLAYTAVRVGGLLRDPNDPRRRGVCWEDLSLEDGSTDVYRKKQQWDAASLPGPVISPLRSYRQLMDPPTERWPAFPTFDQRTLAGLVQEELADRGERPEAITERREGSARDLLLTLDEDVRPPSIATDGARSILQRLSAGADIDIAHPKHDYLAPHGGRRGTDEVRPAVFGEHSGRLLTKPTFGGESVSLKGVEPVRPIGSMSETLELPNGEVVTPDDVFLYNDYPYRFSPLDHDEYDFKLVPLYWGESDMDVPFPDEAALAEQWDEDSRGTLPPVEWEGWLRTARRDDRFGSDEVDALARELPTGDDGFLSALRDVLGR